MKRGKKDSRVPADAAAEQRSTFCPVDSLAIAVIKGVERRKGEPSADTIKCQTRSAGRRLQAEWRSAGQAAPERLIRTCRRAGYLSAPISRLDDTSWDECQIYLGAEQNHAEHVRGGIRKACASALRLPNLLPIPHPELS